MEIIAVDEFHSDDIRLGQQLEPSLGQHAA
jgi:hypothetical protein